MTLFAGRNHLSLPDLTLLVYPGVPSWVVQYPPVLTVLAATCTPLCHRRERRHLAQRCDPLPLRVLLHAMSCNRCDVPSTVVTVSPTARNDENLQRLDRRRVTRPYSLLDLPDETTFTGVLDVAVHRCAPLLSESSPPRDIQA